MEFAQRLLSTRGGTIAVSALAAALAAAVFIAYLHRYRDSVKSSSTPASVLVAQGLIEKGTPGDVVGSQGLYQVSSIPQGEILEGAITDPDSLRGRVAIDDIYPGKQLTASQFSASTSNILSNRIAKDQRAVTVPIDPAHGMAGEIQTGDHVDVFAGFNVKRLRPNGSPDPEAAERAVLKMIMEDILVLSAPADAGGGFSAATKAELTVRATDKQAADLAFASDNGKLWIVLRPKTGASPTTPDIVSLETVLFGVPPISVVQSLGGK